MDTLERLTLIFAIIINIIFNFSIFRKIKERQKYLMKELWNFEDYIKNFVREELEQCQQQQD